MSEYVASKEYWKVITEDFDTHTDGLTFDEAVELSRELNDMFPNEYYIPYPDLDYEDRQEYIEKCNDKMFSKSVDGWEDIYPDRENN
jgi:hypothetical protein